jgi:hypothetical protein
MEQAMETMVVGVVAQDAGVCGAATKDDGEDKGIPPLQDDGSPPLLGALVVAIELPCKLVAVEGGVGGIRAEVEEGGVAPGIDEAGVVTGAGGEP